MERGISLGSILSELLFTARKRLLSSEVDDLLRLAVGTDRVDLLGRSAVSDSEA